MIPLAFGWRDVLFANWPVEADAIDERLPDSLAVQTFDGTGWLTIVPFVNVETRPRGLPRWVGVELPELNLRTYVTHEGQQGVYFFSLDADGLAAVLGARITHRLPYYYASISIERSADRVRFESRRRQPGDRPADFAATYWRTGDAFRAEPDSRAEFLTQRHRLYTEGPDGTLRHTDVAHDRWPLYPAEVAVDENTLFTANGFDHPEGEPICYYSPGVDVVTTTSKPVR